MTWSEQRGARISWGGGAVSGSAFPNQKSGGHNHNVYYLISEGKVVIPFGYMANRPPFTDPSLRQEYRDRLATAGFNLTGTPDKWPSISLKEVLHREDRDRFLGVLDWAESQITSYAQAPAESAPIP
jgi:hypothetical protein